MAYRIEITRQPRWGSALGDPIEADEWADLIYEDDELEWDDANPPYGAVWTGPGDGTRFTFADGVVATTEPGPYATWKMAQMAERLSAVVEGEGGEHYNGKGQAFVTPEQQAAMAQQSPVAPKSWMSRFLTKILRRSQQVPL